VVVLQPSSKRLASNREKRAGTKMARWILICPNCAFRFPHSNIEPTAIQESRLDPFHVIAKPKFSGGEKLACPNCKVESVYEAFELIYDAEDTATAMG
jgi:hypothetical protein